MSNSNDMKEKKFEEHPDFEELLKAERSRTEPGKQDVKPKNNEGDLDLEGEFDHLDDYDDDLDLDEPSLEEMNKETNKPDLKKSERKHEDLEDLNEVASGGENEDDAGQSLDDSMEFNFDDTSSSASEEKTETTAIKKEPVKKSGNLFTYIVVAVVVVVGGGALYGLTHRSSHQASANVQQGTGFKPVLPAVHELPQTLPPAVPQSATPVTTSMMGNATDDQILPDSVQNGAGGSSPVTMLQINRQQLLGLLANFQKVVNDSGKSMTDQVDSLKSSITNFSRFFRYGFHVRRPHSGQFAA